MITTLDEPENSETIDETSKTIDIIMGFPEDNDDTDEDSDDDERPDGDVSHLGRQILQAPCIIDGLNDSANAEDASTSKDHEIRNKKRRLNDSKIEWKKGPTTPSFLLPEPNISLGDDERCILEDADDPIDFFRLFFNDEILELIVNESNLYAETKGIVLRLTKDELEKVFGILLLSGYNQLPSARLYWSTDNDVRNSLVCASIHRDRFFLIIRNLHFAHRVCTNDPGWKIRPLLNHLNEAFEKYMQMIDTLSIDESMIEYFGPHHFKQFIQGKPIRYGFKVWTLCSSTGACHKFVLYTGRTPREDGISLGEAVVHEMASNIPPGCHVFMDRFFTSIPVLQLLSDRCIGATGTIQRNRLRGAQNVLAPESTFKKEQRGSYDMVSGGGIAVVQWLDSKTVTLASNTLSAEPITMCKRFSKARRKDVQVQQPKIVKSYNKNMGGVDLLNQMICCYRTRIRIRKWYWKIFTWCLDLACANAFHAMAFKRKRMPYLSFRRSIVQSLLSENVKICKRSLIGREHIVQRSKQRLRCKLCHSQTVFRCNSCDVALHSNCFSAYHKK